MATTTGQAILAMIETDVLQVAGPAILQYLTNVKTAGGDPIKQTAALPTIESNLLGSIVTMLQAKLATLITPSVVPAVAHSGGPQ